MSQRKHGQERICTSNGFQALRFVSLAPPTTSAGIATITESANKRMRRRVKESKFLPQTSRFGYRKNSSGLTITVKEYPHNLISLGGVVDCLAGKNPREVPLPKVSKSRAFDTLFSKDAKKLFRHLHHLARGLDLTIAVDSNLWWNHLLDRYHELGIDPPTTRFQAVSSWSASKLNWTVR